MIVLRPSGPLGNGAKANSWASDWDQVLILQEPSGTRAALFCSIIGWRPRLPAFSTGVTYPASICFCHQVSASASFGSSRL